MGLRWPLLVVIPDTGQEIEVWPRGAQLVSVCKAALPTRPLVLVLQASGHIPVPP